MLGKMRLFFVFIFVIGAVYSTSYTSDGTLTRLTIGDIPATHGRHGRLVYQSADKRDFLSRDGEGNRCVLSTQEAYDAMLRACHKAGIAYFEQVSVALDWYREAHLLRPESKVELREKDEIAKKND